MSSWYYLISSLPELAAAEGFERHPYPLFESLAEEELDSSTLRLMKECFLLNDVANCIACLSSSGATGKDPDEEEILDYLSPSMYSRDDWKDAILNGESVLGVFSDFLWDYRAERRLYPDSSLQDELYRRLMNSLSGEDDQSPGSGSPVYGFPRDYLIFEMRLRNLSRALSYRNSGRKPEDIVVPFDDFSQQIARSQATDFGLGGELDIMAPLMEFRDNSTPLAFEETVSRVRWAWLDRQVDYRLFSSEAVFSYAIKIADVQRWLELSPEKGRKSLDALLEGLHNEILSITREEIHT